MKKVTGGSIYRALKRLEPGLEPGAGWESDALPTELRDGQKESISAKLSTVAAWNVIGQIYDVTDPWPDTHIWLVYLPRKHKRQKNLSNRIYHLKKRLYLIITNYVIWGKCEVIRGHWPQVTSWNWMTVCKLNSSSVLSPDLTMTKYYHLHQWRHVKLR